MTARRDPRGDSDQPASRLISAALDSGAPLSGAHWQELRTFLAVAKLKSFNKAAQSLGITHVTAARHIRRLHDRYKAPLVVATKHGSILTEKGAQMLDVLSRMDRALYALDEDLSGRSTNAASVVRLSISDGLGMLFVVPQLERLTAAHPNISVYIQRPNNLRHLREDKADVMIGFSPPSGEDLTATPIGYFHFLSFASPDYFAKRAARGESGTAHSFVDAERFRGDERLWGPWNRLTESGRTVHWCDPSLSYSFMVKMGLGIGLLPSYNLLEPMFRHVDTGVDIKVPLYLVALTERLTVEHVRIVFRFVADIFAENRTWFGAELPERFDASHRPAGYRHLSAITEDGYSNAAVLSQAPS